MHSRPTQWDILPQNQSMIRQYYKVKGSQKSQFKGVRRSYHIWRRRFIDIALTQPLAEPLRSVKTFIIFEDRSVLCTDNKEVGDRGVVGTDNKEAEHRLKLRNILNFSIPKENILAVNRHIPPGVREFRESSDCDGKSKPSSRSRLFRSIQSNGRATEQVDMPCHEHSLCIRMRTQQPNSQKA
jgi:hypothetical protein